MKNTQYSYDLYASIQNRGREVINDYINKMKENFPDWEFMENPDPIQEDLCEDAPDNTILLTL
jgi:hypothetical protein